MLTLLLIIPLIGSLLLLPIVENSQDQKNRMRTIALATSLINLVLSIIL